MGRFCHACTRNATGSYRQKQEEASAAQKQFFHPTGDHLTIASVFFAYKQVGSLSNSHRNVSITHLNLTKLFLMAPDTSRSPGIQI